MKAADKSLCFLTRLNRYSYMDPKTDTKPNPDDPAN